MLDHAKDANSSSEPIIIVGVVRPRGAGGGQVGDKAENVWILHFVFEIWRDPNSVLHTTKLIVRRHVTHEEFDWYINRIKPYAILAARVTLTGSKEAELLEILEDPITPDEALAQRVAEMQKPKSYEHAVFGTLTLNREFDWYEATATWAGREIELILDADEIYPADDTWLEAALHTAIKLWDDESYWNQRCEDFVVQEMLPLYNDGQEDWPGSGWREDDPELTPEEFLSRIHLETIIVYSNGEFSFHYDAGVLFSEHDILVRGNLRDGLTRADI